jgi:hypothetical protein
MAAPQGPVCELRLLTIHRYTPGSTKGGAMPCAIEHLGRRGKPVKRQRFIPAERAMPLPASCRALPAARSRSAEPAGAGPAVGRAKPKTYGQPAGRRISRDGTVVIPSNSPMRLSPES